MYFKLNSRLERDRATLEELNALGNPDPRDVVAILTGVNMVPRPGERFIIADSAPPVCLRADSKRTYGSCWPMAKLVTKDMVEEEERYLKWLQKRFNAGKTHRIFVGDHEESDYWRERFEEVTALEEIMQN